MKLAYWQIVFEAHRKVLQLRDKRLPTESTTGEGRAMALVGTAELRTLQEELLDVVASLERGLGTCTEYRASDIDDALQAFVYLVDELVQRRLADGEEDWPLLQEHLFQQNTGGDLFYELANKKLLSPEPGRPLVYEMLHFCLTAGFGGRYLGKEPRLREYKERLAAVIPRPELPDAPLPAAPVEPPLLYEFPVRYYAAAGFFVLALPVVLWWLSNRTIG
jgi:type VI secretion system protein ImpK